MVKSDGVPSGQQLCAGEEDVGGVALLVGLHAGRGREVEEERPPFPFPRGTGSDGERGHGAKPSNLQPWWLPSKFREKFRKIGRDSEVKGDVEEEDGWRSRVRVGRGGWSGWIGGLEEGER